MVGAIEPRLTHIYPVAGSMPFEVDIDPAATGLNFSSARGDYEQSNQFFYRQVAGYLDLYLPSASYRPRKAVYFYNLSDNCCFPAVVSFAFSTELHDLAQELFGNQLIFVVDRIATKHEVSSEALRQIVADFAPQ